MRLAKSIVIGSCLAIVGGIASCKKNEPLTKENAMPGLAANLRPQPKTPRSFPAWPNPRQKAPMPIAHVATPRLDAEPPMSLLATLAGGVLAFNGCKKSDSGGGASCKPGYVSTDVGCCPNSYPYGCSDKMCHTSPCSGGGGGGGCTAQKCCGGLYECNNRCYSTCTVGSQPCCTQGHCVCYTPCC